MWNGLHLKSNSRHHSFFYLQGKVDAFLIAMNDNSLVYVLRFFLQSKKLSETDVPLNWEKLLHVASQQTVLGLVSDVVDNNYDALNVPVNVKLPLYVLTKRLESRNIKTNRVLYLLVRAFSTEGIPCILLKGQGCAQFYDAPLHRSPGDIDLYVGVIHYERACSCLYNNGLIDGKGHSDIKHVTINCRGVDVELHKYPEILPCRKRNNAFQMAMESVLYQDKKCGFYVNVNGETSREGGEDFIFVPMLPLELNATYVFIHMFRHFIGGGIRLRQVVDWLMICRQQHLNYAKVSSLLSDFGFLMAWKVFANMAVVRMGFPKKEILLGANINVADSEDILKLLLVEYESNIMNTSSNLFKRCIWLLGFYASFLKPFRIFPRYCLVFLWNQIRMNLRKHL